MNTMETLLHDLEKGITKHHGAAMTNLMIRQGQTSYSVKYEFGEDDNAGTLFLIATEQDMLCISALQGSDFINSKEIYSTPYISNINKAKQMLEKVKSIIEDSAYEAYLSDIKLIAQVIKDAYGRKILAPI